MLEGIVDLASEATDCHACFIYLIEGERLTVRAASPMYAEAVGTVSMSLDEGLTGWVARRQEPAFIRENAMHDPRMKFFPLLEEERFQSMVAVPILSRSGATIGVIVLHTEAPREFTEDTRTLLVHIASLVSGAIENAQLYDRERRRVEALTRLSALAQALAAATDVTEIGRAVAQGTRRLLGAEICELYRHDEGETRLALLASSREDGSTSPAMSAPELVTPLAAGGERIGLLCARAQQDDHFTAEDTEIARAIAHLAAIAIKRAELITALTNTNTIKDLFEALAAGATTFAAAKAAEVRCDLHSPYLVVYAEPTHPPSQAADTWRIAARGLGQRLSQYGARATIESGPGPVRAVIAFGGRTSRDPGALLRACRELGQQSKASIGISELRDSPTEAARAYREAVDAATIGKALMADGGAIAYSELGPYSYLVHISAEHAPQDRMRVAVDTLIAYDSRRHTALLDTLERFLAERRSVIQSARALFIHPNTLRQRLGRIEELTGLELDTDDLLSLELAIKLARLHGRPSATT
jgi:GAF domain-containing protein